MILQAWQEGGILLVLIIAVYYLCKYITDQQRQMQKKSDDMYKEEKTRHVIEEKELKKELKSMHDERKLERTEWLIGLNGITEAVKDLSNNVYNKLDNMEEDIELIKEKVNIKK